MICINYDKTGTILRIEMQIFNYHKCARRVSGKTFNLKVFGTRKPNGLSEIVKVYYSGIVLMIIQELKISIKKVSRKHVNVGTLTTGWMIPWRGLAIQQQRYQSNGKIERRYQIWCTRRVSGITFIRYAQYRNIEKLSNLKVFGSNKAKWHKHDSLIRLRSHISEQESLSLTNNYIIQEL